MVSETVPGQSETGHARQEPVDALLNLQIWKVFVVETNANRSSYPQERHHLFILCNPMHVDKRAGIALHESEQFEAVRVLDLGDLLAVDCTFWSFRCGERQKAILLGRQILDNDLVRAHFSGVEDSPVKAFW